MTVGGVCVQLNHIEINVFAVGIQHIKKTRKCCHPFGFVVVFHIALSLQFQQHRNHLFYRILQVGSQVAGIEMHLPIHIAEPLQELLHAHHGMGAVEALQPLEILVAEIIHRHHIALTVGIDTLHAAEIDSGRINVPIHRLNEKIEAVKIIVKRPVAEVLAFLLAEKHHFAGLVIIPETQIVMVDGILFDAHRISQEQPHRNMVGNQNLVLRHHEALRHGLQHLPATLPEMENGLVVDTAKHIHLIAHHADTTLKINVFHQVFDGIIGTIRLHAGIHRLFVGRVHQHLVLVTAQNGLVEVPPFVKRHRVNRIF